MNLGLLEIGIAVISIVLIVAWVMGVMKLFQKNHTTLGWVAIVGIIVPIVALVGYAGWFVENRSTAA